ncbi:PAS domain-containing protein [Tenacibaculum sp. SZ-18]|uniref:PAS domain-containing protein n=1 Tax=Tenacibaculum sp. SZ-18 TaxID=754423 RepID=UPI0012FDD186|nr:PAS domain-containing protein [Tenacibaculum sp. SZ-18]
MKSLDLFLNSLCFEKYQEFKGYLKEEENHSINLLSFDFHVQNLSAILKKKSIQNDIQALEHIAKKEAWIKSIESILTKNPFEALILTDINRSILWVNDGFTKMTGYPRSYALQKAPQFLQGRKTSEETRKRIREKLQRNKPFKEVIINHRKDNTTYKCELHIFPLMNNNKTTHFLALEKQIA